MASATINATISHADSRTRARQLIADRWAYATDTTVTKAIRDVIAYSTVRMDRSNTGTAANLETVIRFHAAWGNE